MERILLILLSIFLFAETVSGAPRAVCQTQPIEVVENEDVLLLCRLDSRDDLSARTLDVKRNDNKQEVVCAYRDGRDYNDPQMDEYRGRTTLDHEALKRGVMNLTISSARLSDNGTYECFVPGLNVRCALHLIVEKNVTKTNVSRTTGTAVEEVTKSDDRGGANREAGRAAVLSTVVVLFLCVLVVLLVALRREQLRRRAGADGAEHQDGAAGGRLLNVSEGD
ncbi:myelin-oligodendrocyte glycoprotein-like isoform X2 [Clinocottus analis]|uniref:myelin-oligodendrocyte glycoprotein-like isoform X2 n=1 Tax=Clinocottus analis TaxID=304258 RepID=UPI0035C162D9